MLKYKDVLKLLTGKSDWTITGDFAEDAPGLREHPHNGTDFALPTGTPLLSPADDVLVTDDRWGIEGVTGNDYRAYGNYTVIYVPKFDRTYALCHTQYGKSEVDQGDVLTEGQYITRSGNTGYTTGPHLHLSVAKGKHTTLRSVLNNAIDFVKDVIGKADSGSKAEGQIWIAPHSTLYDRNGNAYSIPTGQHGLYGEVFETVGNLTGFRASWLKGTDTAYYKHESKPATPKPAETNYVGKSVTIQNGSSLYDDDGSAFSIKTNRNHTVEALAQRDGKIKFKAGWLIGVNHAWARIADLV